MYPVGTLAQVFANNIFANGELYNSGVLCMNMHDLLLSALLVFAVLFLILGEIFEIEWWQYF